jgi:hypothetical protein
LEEEANMEAGVWREFGLEIKLKNATDCGRDNGEWMKETRSHLEIDPH